MRVNNNLLIVLITFMLTYSSTDANIFLLPIQGVKFHTCIHCLSDHSTISRFPCPYHYLAWLTIFQLFFFFKYFYANNAMLLTDMKSFYSVSPFPLPVHSNFLGGFHADTFHSITWLIWIPAPLISINVMFLSSYVLLHQTLDMRRYY